MSTTGESIPFPKSGSAEAAAKAAAEAATYAPAHAGHAAAPAASAAPASDPAAELDAKATSLNRDADDSAAPESELLNRVVQGAHEAIDKLAEHAAPHVQRLQASVVQTGDKLQAQAEQVRQTGDEWTESLRKTVREHPLASVAAAVALGMIMARLTS